MTLKEFRIWITEILIDWAYYMCPHGKFKMSFHFFLNNNLKILKL